MKGKKLVAIILAVVMVLSLVTLAFAADRYTDVSEDAWYYEAVDFVTDKGLMDGISATSFMPDEAATRAVLVTLLYRLEGSPETTAANPFSDVEDDGIDTLAAIVWASENGIVKGYGNGKFGPADPVTREQMAAVLYRYYEYKGYDVEKTAELAFSDAAQVSGWALTAMQWAVAEEIVEGDSGAVNPKGTVSRSELASLIYKAFARKVTFDSNSYVGKDQVVVVIRGEAVEKPESPRCPGLVFAGWYTKAVGGDKFDFDQPITEDTTVYAHWWVISVPEESPSSSDSGSQGSAPTPTGTPSF